MNSVPEYLRRSPSDLCMNEKVNEFSHIFFGVVVVYIEGAVWSEHFGCGAGAEKPKLNCLPALPEQEPKLRIAAPTPAPAPFYLPQTWRNFYRKNHGCWRSICEFLLFYAHYLQSKNEIVNVFFISFWSRGWSRSRKIQICGSGGAGAEINIFASATRARGLKWI